MNKKILTTTSLIIAVVLFLAINIVSKQIFSSARVDLTETKLYTLSEGTKNILQNLEEPITLRFFLSEKLATSLSINSYAERVKDLLMEYQRIAGGKINLITIDPEPFSETEDQAEGYGLQGVPIDDSNTTFYFGIAGSDSTNNENVIPFFSPNREEFLEYDLTKFVYQLAYPKQKVVGLMSTLPIQGDTANASPFTPQNSSNQAWMIVDHIKQLLEVKTVATDIAVIPEDIEVLMLVHPMGLSNKTLYAIDQFVLNGGRAIIFSDPYSEVYTPPSDPKNPFAAMQAPRNSDLTKLFDAWGIEVTDKVVGNLQTAQKVQMQKGKRMSVVTYPVWMDLNGEQYFNTDDIVTGKLGNIVMATAGHIVEKGDVATEITPLIESGAKSMQIDVAKLGFMSEPENLVRDFKPEKKFTLVARITGPVKTAFPDGKPKVEEPKEGEPEVTTEAKHIAESVNPINIIVVADTDILEDKFWVRTQNMFGQRLAIPHAANATFVSNALDNLTGSNDLISVRNRGNFTRPFTKVEEIQQQAEQRFREKEKELLARLSEADNKIREMQRQKQEGNELALNIKQQKEIANFRNEKIKVRKELRNVQHELRKNIENLETQMKFINIGLMPLLIGLGGITLGVLGRRRRKSLRVARG
ncbi:Gldg family protein [Candidatus Halobeggiatoa sp. HSG11]|nr:Gldg family protein [Candidatus Halobeggiatoa sp. HSG11]